VTSSEVGSRAPFKHKIFIANTVSASDNGWGIPIDRICMPRHAWADCGMVEYETSPKLREAAMHIPSTAAVGSQTGALPDGMSCNASLVNNRTTAPAFDPMPAIDARSPASVWPIHVTAPDDTDPRGNFTVLIPLSMQMIGEVRFPTGSHHNSLAFPEERITTDRPTSFCSFEAMDWRDREWQALSASRKRHW